MIRLGFEDDRTNQVFWPIRRALTDCSSVDEIFIFTGEMKKELFYSFL